ncbi:hypothetical protein AB0P12_25610 [Streptomyces subrutilus]
MTSSREHTVQTFETTAPISVHLDIPTGHVRFIDTGHGDTTARSL